MNSIVDVLKNSPDYIGGTGRTEEEIQTAEKQLGVKFAPDYRCYLMGIGLACFDGHELTGICKQTRLNVVDVTIDERNANPEVSKLYVIEQGNIDGIVIWQATSGEIYQTVAGDKYHKICDSLAEYVTGEYQR